MNLLNRYILRELLKLFLAVLLVISAAFVIQRLIFLTEWSMHRGIGMLGVAKMLACLFPGLFLTAIPLVSLFVMVVVLSQLSEDNELVVMMSCGRNLLALAKPVLLFALLSTLLTAYLAFFLAPNSLRWFEIVRWELLQSKSEKALPTQTFVEFGRDSNIYIQSKGEDGLNNLVIYQAGNPDWLWSAGEESENYIFARRGRIVSKPGAAESQILLENGVFISHQQFPELDQQVQFERAVARVDFEGAEKLQNRLQRQMQAADLSRLIAVLRAPKSKSQKSAKSGGGILQDARVELSQRLSQVLACLLLMLWGLGLGIKPPRTSRTVSYLLGALAGFGFYYLNVVFKALALKQMMPIEPALFSPCCLILLSGAWLMRERLAGREPLHFLYQLDEYLRQWRAEKKGR
jgi:lipopolysaccharide export LptBFGC system permease protein LptF